MKRFGLQFLLAETAAIRFALWLDAAIITFGFWRSLLERNPAPFLMVVPSVGWATLWTAYVVSGFWRIVDANLRPAWTLSVNLLGAFIYCVGATGLLVARWPHVELAASTTTMAAASIWVLARTAINYGPSGD